MTDPKPDVVGAVGNLTDQIIDLQRKVLTDLARQVRTTRMITYGVCAALVAVVALTVILGSTVMRVNGVAQEVQASVSVQRQKVLCPLYQIFLDSERFTPPGQTPEQEANRVHAFQVIHEGYDSLKCSEVK